MIELTGAGILPFLPGAGPGIRKRAGQEGNSSGRGYQKTGENIYV